MSAAHVDFRGMAALLLVMSFSYLLATTYPTPQPLIDYPRALVGDTQEFQPDGVTRAYIFSDQEIQGITQVVANVFQSSMVFDPPMNQQIPQTPVSFLRIAAYLNMAMAATPSKLAGIVQLLDVKLSMKDSAAALQKQAATWLEIDDDAGAFVIIEQVNDPASFRDRFWKEVQRQVFL